MIGTDHKLYSLTGNPGASYMVTGDFGDETNWSMFRRATPRYRTQPSSGTGTNYYRSNLGVAPTQDQTITQSSQARFDFRRVARWHRVRFDWIGPVSLNGLDVDIKQASPE